MDKILVLSILAVQITVLIAVIYGDALVDVAPCGIVCLSAMTMPSQSVSPSLLSRRFTVLTVYGGYLCLALVVASGQMDAHIMPSIQTLIAGIMAWSGVWILSRMAPHWRLGQAPDAELDERELSMRLRAYYLAYVIFNATVFLFLVGASLLMDIAKVSSVNYVQIMPCCGACFSTGGRCPLPSSPGLIVALPTMNDVSPPSGRTKMTDNPFTQPLRKTMNDPQFDWVRPHACGAGWSCCSSRL